MQYWGSRKEKQNCTKRTYNWVSKKCEENGTKMESVCIDYMSLVSGLSWRVKEEDGTRRDPKRRKTDSERGQVRVTQHKNGPASKEKEQKNK